MSEPQILLPPLQGLFLRTHFQLPVTTLCCDSVSLLHPKLFSPKLINKATSNRYALTFTMNPHNKKTQKIRLIRENPRFRQKYCAVIESASYILNFSHRN